MIWNVKLARAVLLVATGVTAASAAISFENEIRPLLETRCVKCHGAAMQMGKFDLRSKPAAPILVPGKPDDSTLYLRLTGHAKPVMPMDGKLLDGDIRKFRDWITAGAQWSGPPLTAKAPLKYWAFEKPKRAPGKTIDQFLDDARQLHGVVAAPEASPEILVRRAYVDLLGLPPTPDQVRAYVNDKSADRWSKLIDQLLASPHYGERWGRHWLDVARYADSNGYEHDFDRPNAWRYRDYVIKAFNDDKPFDRFLVEQLAGDELEKPTYDSLIATGFLRNYAKVDYREKSNPQFRYDYLDDMIATLGRGVMGLTVACARCHDHKFDPIPQKDYYRIQAALFAYVEIDHPLVPEAEAKAWKAQNDAVTKRAKAVQEKIREQEWPYRQQVLAKKYERYPAHIREAINTPEEKRTPGQKLLAEQIIRTVNAGPAEIERLMPAELKTQRQQWQAELKAIEKDRPKPIPVAAGISDGDYRFAPDGPGDEPAPGKARLDAGLTGTFLHEGAGQFKPEDCHLLLGGDMGNKGPVVEPGFVTVATTGKPATALPPAHGRTSGRRRALGEWLASPDNPLTARVFVNRVWHHHFGRGIVASLDNFGNVGDRPTHPELLDWLAVEFMENGWSVKHLHRTILNSKAYRMASGFAAEKNLAVDADNQWLWRFRAQRLEAEIVRDQILAVAGTLNRTQYGKAVFPALPEDTLAAMNKGIWARQKEEDTWRRSVYVYRKRGLPFPFFEVFDLPDQNTSCGRRSISTVPTQALTLMNNGFVLDQAARFADRVEKLAPGDRRKQVELAFELALGRAPEPREKDLVESFAHGRPLKDLTHVLFNLNEFLYLR